MLSLASHILPQEPSQKLLEQQTFGPQKVTDRYKIILQHIYATKTSLCFMKITADDIKSDGCEI